MVLGLPFEADHFRYDTWNNHHPIAYTALVSLFVNAGASIGGLTFGVGLFSLFQMTVLACCAAYGVCWMRKRSGYALVGVAALLFFALNPLIARYAVTLWKDVLFAGAMLCFCLSLFDLVASKGLRLREKSFCLRFVLFSAAVFALRSNGFVVVAVSVLVAFLLCSRVRKQAAILGFGSLVGLFVVQAIVLNAFSIAPAHFSESVALPLQQIAKTVVYDGDITKEQAAFIDEIIPLEELESVYRSDTPNPIKFSPEFNDDFLESHKVEFLTVWIQLLPSNFGAYVSAWLHETTGFWYTGLDSWLVTDPGYAVYSDEYEGARNLLPSSIADSSLLVGERPTQIMAKLVPPLCNAASLVWFAVFVFLFAIGSRRGRTAAALTPLLTFWATYLLAAPIYNEFRYMFVFHFCVPFVVFCLLEGLWSGRGEQSETDMLPEASEESVSQPPDTASCLLR